jgi:hypothetical protein
MKKSIIFAALLLAACTPPMKSETNKCKCTPDHCCADTVTVKESFPEYPTLPQVEENVYEEIPAPEEEEIL